MESSWRLNVWKLGLTFNDTYLAAPIVGTPDTYLCQLRLFGIRFGAVVQIVAGTHPWIPLGTVFPTPLNPHFPYGVGVEPDVH